MGSRAGITRSSTGAGSAGPRTTDFSSSSKRAIRDLPSWRRASFWNKAAAVTSRLFTKNKFMLRGFFLIFLLIGVAIVAVFGLRGQKSTGSPIEVFPDMVRQPKVRAQAPLGFFADGRGARVPVAGTVPMGYEMPQASNEPSPGAAPVAPELAAAPRLGFSGGTDYRDTGKMATNWGTGLPMAVTAELMERGRQRFNINCAVCHGMT